MTCAAISGRSRSRPDLVRGTRSCGARDAEGVRQCRMGDLRREPARRVHDGRHRSPLARQAARRAASHKPRIERGFGLRYERETCTKFSTSCGCRSTGIRVCRSRSRTVDTGFRGHCARQRAVSNCGAKSSRTFLPRYGAQVKQALARCAKATMQRVHAQNAVGLGGRSKQRRGGRAGASRCTAASMAASSE